MRVEHSFSTLCDKIYQRLTCKIYSNDRPTEKTNTLQGGQNRYKRRGQLSVSSFHWDLFITKKAIW